MPIAFWRKNLPHWEQDGKIHYITFRLSDSLPQPVVDKYLSDKERFVKEHPQPWDDDIKRQYSKLISNPVENFLDAGYGNCILKEPAIRQHLIDAINYYDADRFAVLAYVIMPNHVHMLAVPLNGYALDNTISSILRFSATGMNRLLGKKGRVWQTEPFDTIVRSHIQYVKCVEYIRHNPDGLPYGWFAFGGWEFR